MAMVRGLTQIFTRSGFTDVSSLRH